MGRSSYETKTIKELAYKLDEWANRREPKLPEHIGHISFYGSLKKAVGNLPDLVLTFLRSIMPEQLDQIQKDLDDLYEKVRFVDHERTDTGEEANIAKCQAQAAAKNLAEKLRRLDELRREQIENSKKPAETEQDIPPTILWRIWTGIKGFIKEAYRITIKSFFDSAMNK